MPASLSPLPIPPGEPELVRAQAYRNWQALHARLAAPPPADSPLTEVGWLGVYHACVAAALPGETASAATAQELFGRLCRPALLDQEPAERAVLAGLVAWLGARVPGAAAVARPLLAKLDYRLYQDVQRLAYRLLPPNPVLRLSLTRYFALRLPALAAGSYPLLSLLLASPAPHAPAAANCAPDPDAAGQDLGLADGLAAELLTQSRLYQAGVPSDDFLDCLRDGVQRLLTLRRPVDFSEQRYSVFPFELRGTPPVPRYDDALTWARGDLGPVLLLHAAADLLPAADLGSVAELVGLNTLLRTTEAATRVASADLYAGAAGLAYLYHKLHQTTGQPSYRQGQITWLRRCHDGLPPLLAAAPSPAEPRHGLLGVALVQLSALAGAELGWDELL